MPPKSLVGLLVQTVHCIRQSPDLMVFTEGRIENSVSLASTK